MTERADAASRQLAELTSATEAFRRLAGLIDATVLAQRAANEVHGLIDTSLVSVAVREGSDVVAMRGVSGNRTRAFARARVPRGVGIGGKILVVDRAVAVEDYGATTTITDDFVDLVVHDEGIHGMLGLPLRYRGQIVGILYAGIRTPGSVGTRVGRVLDGSAATLGPLLGAARQAEQSVELGREDERRRVAVGLHDTIGQLLFSIGVSAQRARDAVPADNLSDLRTELERIERHASQAASHLREALHTLTARQPEGTLPSLARTQADEFADRTGIPTHFVVLGTPRELRRANELLLLRALREALHNVAKHTTATSVFVTIDYGPRAVSVIVQDDGGQLPEGFVIRSRPTAGRQLGLASLQEQMAMARGTVVLIPNDDGGVTFRATLDDHDGMDDGGTEHGAAG